MTRFKKCEMGDCDRTATRKIRLYLPIEEEHLGPITYLEILEYRLFITFERNLWFLLIPSIYLSDMVIDVM